MIIESFKPIIPSTLYKDKVPIISYSRYSPKEREEKKKSNPYSFLHVLDPQAILEEEKHTPDHYKKVLQNFISFVKKKIIIQRPRKSLVLLRKKVDNQEYTMVIGAVPVSEYISGNIIPHENVNKEREMRLTTYLNYCDINAEPVILFHQENSSLQSFIKKKMTQTPSLTIHPIEEKKATYDLWFIESEEEIQKCKSLIAKINHAYIADGHHRMSSSSLFYESVLEQKKEKIKNTMVPYCLSALVSEKQIQIFSYYRALKTFSPYSRSQFLEKLGVYFMIVQDWNNIPFIPEEPSTFGMCLGGVWYRITLKEAFLSQLKDVFEEVPTAIFSKFVLEKVMRIFDESSSGIVSAISGNHPPSYLEQQIAKGKYSVGFTLAPVSLSTLKKVTEKALKFPYKSTWIEPKLLTGIIIMDLNFIKKFN